MAQTEMQDALNSYITDMLALEEHIAKAVDAQLGDLRRDHPEFAGTLSKAATITAKHIGALTALKTSRKMDTTSSVAEAVKRAGSVVAGLGAAAIDLVRSESLSKDLRDDYTAYSLASIGYQMLLTSSVAMSDDEVSGHARTHFADYAQIVMDLSRVIPGAVIEDLKMQHLPVRGDAGELVAKEIKEIWQKLS
ncbi:MAG: hypothetical protein ABJB66_06555 [Gemmatimonadaceae bacterium]